MTRIVAALVGLAAAVVAVFLALDVWDALREFDDAMFNE